MFLVDLLDSTEFIQDVHSDAPTSYGFEDICYAVLSSTPASRHGMDTAGSPSVESGVFFALK